MLSVARGGRRLVATARIDEADDVSSVRHDTVFVNCSCENHRVRKHMLNTDMNVAPRMDV